MGNGYNITNNGTVHSYYLATDRVEAAQLCSINFGVADFLAPNKLRSHIIIAPKGILLPAAFKEGGSIHRAPRAKPDIINAIQILRRGGKYCYSSQQRLPCFVIILLVSDDDLPFLRSRR